MKSMERLQSIQIGDSPFGVDFHFKSFLAGHTNSTITNKIKTISNVKKTSLDLITGQEVMEKNDDPLNVP